MDGHSKKGSFSFLLEFAPDVRAGLFAGETFDFVAIAVRKPYFR